MYKQFDFATTDLKSSRHNISTDVSINSLASRLETSGILHGAREHVAEMCITLAISPGSDDST